MCRHENGSRKGSLTPNWNLSFLSSFCMSCSSSCVDMKMGLGKEALPQARNLFFLSSFSMSCSSSRVDMRMGLGKEAFLSQFFLCIVLFVFPCRLLMSPWYHGLRGWLGVNNQLSIYILTLDLNFNWCTIEAFLTLPLMVGQRSDEKKKKKKKKIDNWLLTPSQPRRSYRSD